MTQERILTAIPHRPPMLLLDEVLEESDERIVCAKQFRDDEFFFQGHYPDFPLVPGVILCEAAMQAGAVLLTRHVQSEAGVPVATRINDVKLRKMIRPGDTIRLEVNLRERLSDAFFLNAVVKCNGKVAARLEFACTLASPENAT